MSAVFSAIDPDGDSLRYLFVEGNILNEMSIDNNGRFSFTPTFERSSSTENKAYNLTVGVSDEYYFYPPAMLNISIKVLNVNRPPTYDGLNRYTAIEGRYFRVKLPISDPDNDSLSSSISGLPAGIVYNSTSRLIQWYPKSADLGTHAISFHISDGTASSDRNINLEVMPNKPYIEPTDEQNIFYVDGANGNDGNDGQTMPTA